MAATDREHPRKTHPVGLFFAVLAMGLIILALAVAVGLEHRFAIGLLLAVGILILPNLVRRLMGGSPAGESEELMPPASGQLRLRCPCCGSPSLDPGVPDQSCPACEWLVDGLPGDAVAPPEEIAAARENFRRFLSVYPPDARPEWSPDAPAPDELELRRDLIERYALALSHPEDRGIWWEIEKLERRVADLELEYSEAAEARAGRDLDELGEEEEELEEERQPILEGREPRRESGSE